MAISQKLLIKYVLNNNNIINNKVIPKKHEK